MPVVPFSNIPVEMPCVLLNDLSTDQQYLWEICDSTLNGQCSLALSTRNPGALPHSRWLTTANRLLQLYIETNTYTLSRSCYISDIRNESLRSFMVQH